MNGKNGIVDVSNNEVMRAEKTKIIIAQETGNYKPNYITYYGKPLRNLNRNVLQIFSNYDKYSGFGGVAVHHLSTLSDLK